MTEHIQAKKRLQSVATVTELKAIFEECAISDEDREMLTLIYVRRKNFGYVADILGYSEDTIKSRHKKCLEKISKMYF